MKKKLQLIIIFCLGIATQMKAQGIVSDFENLLLPIPPMGSYWNGSDQTGGFSSGGMYFPNTYDTAWGGYWATGFAYSSMVDSVTSGFTNLYAAKPATGFNGSANYAVVQNNAVARLDNIAPTMVMQGFYVTNGTYAFNSMRDGDIFARKFGDTTGTNSAYPQGGYPDYFKLTIKSYVGGQLGADSVEFYLADFRFTNDSLDYIVDSWEWVDCSILQVFDSLQFTLSSSDNNGNGMNTPAFFCIDNLTIDVTVGQQFESKQKNIIIYPNPTHAALNVLNNNTIDNQTYVIYDLTGKKVLEVEQTNAMQSIGIAHLQNGFYTLQVISSKGIQNLKFLKQ
jgi:hypothetical protein